MEQRQNLFWGLLGISMLCLAHHFFLWGSLVAQYHFDWGRLLSNWDSGWYNRIASYGYFGKSWAFFPLYPMSVRGLLRYFDGIPPQILGTIFSSIVFVSFTVMIARLVRTKGTSLLLPSNLLSWFFFVYSASSFVFHSHHTESLFVLLSFLAFWTAFEGRWLWAAIFAGLSWLTRHQGAFVSFCVALQSVQAFYIAKEYRKLFVRFLLSSLISVSIFAAYPIYQYMIAGNPLLFIQSQAGWSHATGLWSVVQTLWFANPEQQKFSLWMNAFHFAYYLFLWVLVYMVWKRNFVLGLYGALSLMILFFQASLLNSFRFGAVLFPLFFFLGERLSSQNSYVKWTLVVLAVYLNHYVTASYAMRLWAY